MLQEESGSFLITLPIVALGSNEETEFGGAEAIVRSAFAALEKAGLALRAASDLFATPCFPAGFGPDFVNAVVVLEPGRSAQEIMTILHRIEADFRRKREHRWGPRTLDLDLIAMGETILPDLATQRHWQELAPERQMQLAPDQLILPHPRLQDRAFVLIPMAQLVANWKHPVIGKTVNQMLAALPEAEKADIRPLARL